MADKTQIWTEFFQKLERDERLLKSKFPQIDGIRQAGSMPLAVLNNYNLAREDVHRRMAFTRDIMRKYADPRTGQRTPEPLPLPGFVVNTTRPVSELLASSPLQLVDGKDITIDAPPVGDSGQLGIAPVIIIAAIIGTTIVISSIVAVFIIDAANEQEVKLAEQSVEFELQRNFARVWDTAQKLILQCAGQNPTPAVLASCWDTVAQRLPDILKLIPSHKLSAGSGLGFFGKLGLAAAGVGILVGGIWVYRKWGRRGGGRSGEMMMEPPRGARGSRSTAHERMDGVALPMARPSSPKRGVGSPPPRLGAAARARGGR